jgi:hypothetical protein
VDVGVGGNASETVSLLSRTGIVQGATVFNDTNDFLRP